ncbi:MAG: type II secretion system protein [Phycisphaerales bacterium]|nr:type II secretion system protein [Phycisphaerales bacterium]
MTAAVPKDRTGGRRLRGVTLVELLMAIGVIFVLLAIALPSLSRSRDSANTTVSLARIRQLVVGVESYATSERGCYPQLAEPSMRLTPLRSKDNSFLVSYFQTCQSWRWAMAEPWFGVPPTDPSLRPPGTVPEVRVRGAVVITTEQEYLYSGTLFSDPGYWLPETRRGDISQFRAVRTSEVRSGSSKGVFIALYPWVAAPELGPHSLVGFADGSARRVALDEFLPPLVQGDGRSHPPGYFRSSLPVVHTPGGVRGRDLK